MGQDQFALDGRHGLGRAIGRPGAGDHRPGLGDGIDAAFLVRRRAERRAVIEPAAPIPLAIPRLTLEGAR